MNGSWNFRGQVVMVTGGASGLGLAGAEAFARAGARLAIADIRAGAAEEAVCQLGGAPHLAVSGDVSDPDDVNAMVETVRRAFGHIDILVNCAGIPDVFRPTVEQDYEQFRRLVDIHLGGTYLVSKTVAPLMLASGGGAICNISSIAGVMGLTPRNAYSAAKAGIAMLTRTLGTEWVSQGVRVNCIAPGYIVTPFLERLVAEGKLDEGRILRRTPIGRLGHATELAEAMLFLCSSNASYISGITLQVDGGYMSWGAPSDAATA